MLKNVKAEFKTLSLGDSTARLGVKLDRKTMNLTQADLLLCGSRCNATIAMTAGGDDDQPDLPLEGAELPTITTVADIKGFNAKPKAFTLGLTMQMSEIDASALAQFAGQSGVLTLDRIGDIPENKKRKPANESPDGASDDEGSTD